MKEIRQHHDVSKSECIKVLPGVFAVVLVACNVEKMASIVLCTQNDDGIIYMIDMLYDTIVSTVWYSRQ